MTGTAGIPKNTIRLMQMLRCIIFNFGAMTSIGWLLSGCSDLGYTPPENSKEFPSMDGVRYSLEGSDTVYFADFPVAYRHFFAPYCATCHSNRWQVSDQRHILNLNTWENVVDFGALSLFSVALGGGMPKVPVDKVPEPVLNDVAAFLSRDTDVEEDGIIGSISGINTPEIERVAEKYCGNCHGHRGGMLSEYDLSTYERWREDRNPILRSLTENTGKTKMPYSGSRQRAEWEINPVDRDRLITWLEEDLPN